MAVAAVFVWLGMVLAVSFVEAPLKLRAPGATLNVFEYVFAVVIAFALFTHETPAALNIAMFLAVGALLTQTIVIRPLLSHRTSTVLPGDEGRRSRAHFAYVALELVKVIALVWTGVLLINT